MPKAGPKSKADRPGWSIIQDGESDISPDQIDNSIPLPPAHLSETAKDHFLFLIKRIREAGKTEDLLLISEASTLWGNMREAQECIDQIKVVVKGERGDGKKNPALQIYRDSLNQYIKILKLLGVETVGKKARQKKENPMAAYLAGRKNA